MRLKLTFCLQNNLLKMKYNLIKPCIICSLVERAFCNRFKSSDSQSVQTIKNLISNFEKTGSLGHVAPKPKNPSEKREMAKNQLKTMVADLHSFSISKAASVISVSTNPRLSYS